jgi:uncharacterized membrane protein YjgN (DUF898 family)
MAWPQGYAIYLCSAPSAEAFKPNHHFMSDIVISSAQPQRAPFQFTGKGSEYFRIWIVNLLLSVITLGIYSAWAKVRREQYFHRHTVLEGSAFDYHGRPSSILKGRVLVIGVLALYQLSLAYMPLAAGTLGVLFMVLWPWITCQALRFRAHNTSWRGIRMHFAGDIGEAIKILYLHGLAVPFSLGFAYPWWKRNFQRFVLGRMQFGKTSFEANPSAGDYYVAYLMASLVVLGFMLVVGLIAGLGVLVVEGADLGTLLDQLMEAARTQVGAVAISFLIYAVMAMLYVFAGTCVRALTTNALFNETRVGPHRFVSQMRIGPLTRIVIGNVVLTIFTLGLYTPFAKVRLARYRASCTSLIVEGGLDDFGAGEAQEVRALGDEAADFLDVDIGF